MSYFAALAESSFKRGPDGETFFYPWGPCGKGYVVSTEAHADAIRSFVRTYFRLALPSAIALVILTGATLRPQLAIVAAFVVLAVLIYWLEVRTLTSHLQSTQTRLTIREA